MNRNIRTVIIAPMASAQKKCPARVPCIFKKKQGQIVLDQIKTIDKAQLIKKLGAIDSKAQSDTISILQKLFSF